jgi:preprotein translocase subunit SecG
MKKDGKAKNAINRLTIIVTIALVITLVVVSWLDKALP